jgi:RNA recognition motif-containing protein
MRIYVGNLSYASTERTLREEFEKFGLVNDAVVMQDNETGRSRGFGFVEMPDADEAAKAIAALNGQEVDGRALTVNEARPQRSSGGGGGGRSFGGGGGGDRRGGGGGGGGRGWR